MKAHKLDGLLEIGLYDELNIAQREGLMSFATAVFYILYGTVVE